MTPGKFKTLATQAKNQPRRILAFTLSLTLTLFAFGCGQTTESQLIEIRSLQTAGQFEPSIVPLRRLLSSDSENSEANYRLGMALIKTGRSSLAVWPLRKAAESEEHGVQAGLVLATSLLANESVDESIRAYSRVLEIDPENKVALSSRASAQVKAGFPELALLDADRLLEIDSEDQLSILLRAGALMDLNRTDEAEEALMNLAEQAAASDDVYDAGRKCAALAIFYKGRNTEGKARKTFLDCLETYPGDPVLQQYASDYFTEISEPEQSVVIWQKAVETTPEDLDLRQKLAQALLKAGNPAQAEATYRESVELFDTADAWRMMANFYRDRADHSKAREALEEAMQRTREVSPAAQFALADILISEGQFERAQQIANSVDEPSYKYLLEGAILQKKGKHREALEKFDAGLKLWPNNPGGRYLAGNAALALGDRTRALAEYREAIRSGERQTDAALRTAEIHYLMGNYGLALQFAERHIVNRPDPEGRAHIIAARAAMDAGSEAQAESILSRLRSRLPDSSAAYVEYAALVRKNEGASAALATLQEANFDLTQMANLAALEAVVSDRVTLGENNQAQKDIEAAIKANPDSAALYELLGRFSQITGQRQAALTAFDQALSLEPNRAKTLHSKANLLQANGNQEEARALFLQAVASDSKSAESLYRIGQIDLMAGNVEAAEERFRAALKIDPSILGANNDLAWILASGRRDLPTALKLAQRAVSDSPSADTLDTLGYAQLQSGDSDAAVITLGLARDKRPESGSILYRLGLALAQQGNKAQAQQVLSQAVATSPFPEAEAAQAELARLQGP